MNEYLTSNSNIAYPFVENAAGLAYIDAPIHGVAATVPLDFLVDAIVIAPATVEKIYLYTITAMGADSFSFVIIDQNSNIVLDSLLNTATFDVSKQYQVFTLEISPINATGKFVVATAPFLAYLAATSLDTYQKRLQFGTNVLNLIAPHIETFELYDALPTVPEPSTPGSINGNARLMAGYNVDILHETSQNNTTEIELVAIPGAGLGLVPCDEATMSSIHNRVMHLLPDENGNIQLSHGDEDCYAIIPDIAAQQFQIQGNCDACCSCEDYRNVAKALKALLDRSKLILDLLNTAKANYELGSTHFNTNIAPDYIGVKMQMNGVGGADNQVEGTDGLIRSGSEGWGSIVCAIKNNGDTHAWPRTFLLKMTAPAAYTIRQVVWEYDGQGGNLQHHVASGAYDYEVEGMNTLPDIVRGKQMSIYIAVKTDDFVLRPHWSGEGYFGYNPIGGAGSTEHLIDTVVFT